MKRKTVRHTPLARLSLIWVGRLSIIFVSALIGISSAHAFTCGTRLVSVGDSKLAIKHKCGAPSWVDRWSEEVTDFPHSTTQLRQLTIHERWIYNRGPQEFITILTFNGSAVASITTGGRGFTMLPGAQRCDFDALSLGVSAGELGARCGEPDAKDQRYDTITQRGLGGKRQVSVTVDEWTYNLGPTQFLRILVFYNGRLAEVKTGERGFSP